MAENLSYVSEVPAQQVGSKTIGDNEMKEIVELQSPKRSDDKGVTVTWKNVRATVKERKNICGKIIQKEANILNGVSGHAKPGSLLAVIGSSGSGKTTLLNTLTCRRIKSLDVTGEVLVNGVSMGADISSISAYVEQDDLFMGELTVKEHLMFTAQLRMDSSISTSEKRKRVDDVIEEMRLQRCQDTRICALGSDQVLSGGELKRLSVASEFLAKPAIMFLDEPTSGLDSYLATVVVGCMKEVAKKGCTVICTIHQPSSEVFEIFDDLMILAMGRVVYHGEVAGAMQHYARNGSVCPANYNPADFYIRKVSIVAGEENKARETIDKLAKSFETLDEEDTLYSRSTSEKCDDITKKEAINRPSTTKSRYRVNFIRQLIPCLFRAIKLTFRNNVVRARFFGNCFTGLVIGLVFLRTFNTPYSSKEVRDIYGLFFILIFSATINGTITTVQAFPLQIETSVREHRNALYSVAVFFLSKNIAELMSFTLILIVKCIIVYFMTGLYPGAGHFFLYVLIVVIMVNTCVSIGYFIACLAKNQQTALTLVAPVLLPIMILSGVFINERNVRVYLRWIKYLSWFDYSSKLLMVNQWRSVESLECDVIQNNGTVLVTSQTNRTLDCLFRNGNDVLEYYDIDQERFGEYFGCMVAVLIGFRLLAFALLFRRFRE
ncbi:protein white-like [Ciona intestinalis]